MTRGARMPGAGAGLGVLTLLLYVVLIINEGDDTAWQVAPWAIAMAAASGMAVVGTVISRERLVFLAGIGFFLIGVPAIFSVGFPLIVAGLLCLLASSHPIAGRPPQLT